MAVKKKKKKRVVRYKRRHSLNIGVIIFILIFVYILFYVGMYMTRDKVSIYEVVQGKNAIIANHSYTGVALRTETVVKASNSGYVNFYVKDGGRVSKTSTVYTLDESGTLAQLLADSTDEDNNSLSDENVSQISYDINKFVSQFDPTDFSTVYDFKYDLDTTLLECINLNKLQSLNATAGTSGNVFQIMPSPYSGIVEFYTDGYEEITPETINDDTFDNSKYKKNKVESGALVEAGSSLFKVISSEDWYLMIPLTEEEVTQYSDTSAVRIRFLKDNLTTIAGFEMMNIGDKYYGKLSLKRYMVRYADYRFIDIQILGTDTEGLKIPKSAVCKKEFYTIPIEYLTTGGATNDQGFYVERFNDSGEQSTVFITPDIFMMDDTFCYVDENDVDTGEIVIKSDSVSKYQVGTTKANLEGVYNVNDGYTEFRRIDIKAESNDYYIIAPGTAYGVQIYDHIVLDSSTVKENKIVFQ